MLRRPLHRMRGLALLGPAFVAALAYVDPGNVAANLSAGASYGYLLLWVLVISSLMAMFVQYQSAKLGLVTGESLTHLVGERLSGAPVRRWAYGIQAAVIAIATDVAEVIGGAVALWLLFGIPLWLGGVVTGVVSLWVLESLRSRSEVRFEIGVALILGVVVIGFGGLLIWAPPSLSGMASGLIPRLAGADSLYLAAAMLGATVMPHAIYLHSRLARDRHGHHAPDSSSVRAMLRIQRLDVGLALLVAGGVNIAMLLFAAAALRGTDNLDSIQAAYQAISTNLGWLPAGIFAVGLLASGLGSSVVGTHAGAGIIGDLLPIRLADQGRRVLTIVPAVALLATGASPTALLVLSQAVLSFGIVFALVPLVRFTGDRELMGAQVNGIATRILGWIAVGLIAVLNLALLALLIVG